MKTDQPTNQQIHDVGEYNSTIPTHLEDLIVNVVTLKQYQWDQAYEQAICLGIEEENIVEYVKCTMKQESFSNYPTEFVEIKDGYVIIGVQAKIIDDETMVHALCLLSKINTNQTSKVEFTNEKNSDSVNRSPSF